MDAALAEQLLPRQHMGMREVGDVDVVTDRGTIARVEIRAVDREGAVLPERRLDREWNDMRLRLMPLADLALGVTPGCVEISEHDSAQTMRLREVFDYPLDHEFGPSVRIDRYLRMLLVDRRSHGNSVRRAGARKDQLVNTRLQHLFEEDQRAETVIAIV